MSLWFAIFTVVNSDWISPSSPLLPTANSRMAVGAYDQSIFLLGGEPESHQLSIYHIDDMNTTDGDSFAFNISRFSDTITSASQYYTAVSNTIYMVDFSSFINIYNMETNTYIYNWMNIPETVGNSGCLTSTTNYLFLLGGSDFGDDLDIVQRFDFSSQQWLSNLPSMNNARVNFACIADPLTNKLYAIGGFLSSIERFIIDTDVTWTNIGDLSEANIAIRAVINGNQVFVIGGAEGFITSSSVNIIDTSNDKVSVSTELLSHEVEYTAAIIVNDRIYAFGGHNGNYLDSWMYYELLTTTPSPYPTNIPTSSPNTKIPTTSTTSTTASTSTSEPSFPPTATDQTSTAFPSKSPTIYNATDVVSYCNDIIVEIINLHGISGYDFMINEELRLFIANTTSKGIAKSADDYGIGDDLFYVEYKSVSHQINITLSLCVDKENVLNVLNDIIIERADEIAGYIKNKTIEYFERIDDVRTDDLNIMIYWESYGSDTIFEDEEATPMMEIPSLSVTIIILALFFLVALISLFDAKCIRKNDYFSAKSIIMASFEVSDTVTDLLFAVFLLLQYLRDKYIEILIASIAAFVFIIIPIIFSVFQLLRKAKKSWFKDDDLSNWLKENGKLLFFFSILTGSSYTAIEIVNCGAFKLEMFNMGLNKQQQIKFNAKRVIGVVCLENIPQMVIQIWYSVRFGVELVTILSIIFSIISIVLAILTIYTQQEIIKNQQVIKIEFDIIGDEIEPKLSSKTRDIKLKLSVLLGVKENLMEIQQPKVVHKGLRFEICLFINEDHYRNLNCESIINAAVNNGELVNIIKQQWKLKRTAMISNVKFIPSDGGDIVEIGNVATNKYASVNTIDDD